MQTLRDGGHDVDWVCEWKRDPGDRAILAHAVANDRIVVTADKGFGELVIRHGSASRGVVLIRSYARISEQRDFLCDALARWSAALNQGALLVVERERVRVTGHRSSLPRSIDPGT